MSDNRLPWNEELWYYLSVIGTLGFWYTVKVVAKKAIIESRKEE